MIVEKGKHLAIGVFYDGRPGHEKQTNGILQELGHLIEVEVSEIHIEQRSFWLELGQWCRYYFLTKSGSPEKVAEFNLLIGTGSRTHIPMLIHKKRYGVPVVTCMSPASLLMNRFDLCFVPQHDGLRDKPNIFPTIGPPNCSQLKNEQDPQRGLILLGGIDTKSHYWQTPAIENYLLTLLQDNNIQFWTIASSPRTPEDTCQMVEKLVSRFDNTNFFRFEDTKRGWVETQYSENQWVWVTADSMSMVYEALTAGCHVGLLPVVWKKKKSKFRLSEDYLVQNNIVIPYDQWVQNSGQWQAPAPLNEAARCAKEIIKRFCGSLH